MREEGYEVKRRGKSLEFCAPGQERFTRSFRLGEEYTEEKLRQRIACPDRNPNGEKPELEERNGADSRYPEKRQQRSPGRKAGSGPTAGTASRSEDRKVSLLVDIQAKLQAGKGEGYARWAKVFNLKEAAKTVNFLTENSVADYEELEARTEAAGRTFDSLSARIKQLEGRMAEKAKLKMHIINYAKTRDVYAAYKRSRYRESFRNQHLEELKKHEAAKAAFDALGGKIIPKAAELSKEYAALLKEKKQGYEEYKAARQEMIDFQTAKRNVDVILGMDEAA